MTALRLTQATGGTLSIALKEPGTPYYVLRTKFHNTLGSDFFCSSGLGRRMEGAVIDIFPPVLAPEDTEESDAKPQVQPVSYAVLQTVDEINAALASGENVVDLRDLPALKGRFDLHRGQVVANLEERVREEEGLVKEPGDIRSRNVASLKERIQAVQQAALPEAKL